MSTMKDMTSLYDVFYEKYNLLYNLYGAERPYLSRVEYEKHDREMIRLIEKANTLDLTMAEIARLKEIEYLLLDDISESFYY